MEFTMKVPLATPPGSSARVERVCTGRVAWRGDSIAGFVLSRLLTAATRMSDRIVTMRFVRFELRPAAAESTPSDIRLTPVTAEIIAQLRAHPDAAHAAFASGLDFWDMGVRNGFVWFENGEPLCFQWQLTESDAAALRTRSDWSTLYPTLGPGVAQREKLWTFSAARRRGLASRFAAAMLAEARRQGITTLVTHVSAENAPALTLVEKSGWKRCGSIVRYEFDLPLFRSFKWSAAVHSRSRAAAAPVAPATLQPQRQPARPLAGVPEVQFTVTSSTPYHGVPAAPLHP
jgi:ribosomal protein S18 acetylase RimI-like enzyme